MDETFDTLKIKIDVDVANDATSKIDQLKDAVNGLKSSASDYQALNTLATNLTEISRAMGGLSRSTNAASSLQALGNFASTLQTIGGNSESFKKGMEDIANAMNSLEVPTRNFVNRTKGIRDAYTAFNGLKAVAYSLTNLQIPDGVQEQFDKLAEAVEKASKVGPGFNSLVNGLKNLGKALEEFKSVDASQFKSVGEILSKLSKITKKLDFKSSSGIKNLAQGLKDLSKIGSGDQKALAENLNNSRIALEQFMKDLGKGLNEEDIARFNQLADSLGKVADAYKHMAAAKREAAKEKDESALTGLTNVTGNIMGSLGDLPFVGKFFGQITSTTQTMTAAFKSAEGASGALGASLGVVAVGLAGIVVAVKGVQKYIEFINNEFDKLSKTLIKVADIIKSFTSSAIESVKSKFDGIGKSVSSFVKDLKSASKVVKDVGKTLSNVFDKFTGGFFKNFEKSLKNIFNMVKRMALRKAINAIFKDINDSFENLVAFSRKHGTEFADSMDIFATSAKYLNNSLVAMVSPIINMVMPVFDALVDKVVELMNVFNQLFSRFSGADMWTKAIKNAKQYGEEAEKSSKKQKKLNNAILSFDEIHKLNGDNGKGKDFEASDLEDWAFEINSLDDLFDFLNEKLKSFISTFKDYLDSINWEKIKSIAYDLGEGVMKLLNTIFGDDGLAIRLGRSLAEIVNTAFAFALGAVDEWDPKAWGQSFVAFFTGIFDNLDWTLIRMTFENFGTKLAEYFNTIFSAEEMFEKLGKTLSNGFNSVLSGISNFVKDIDLKQFGIDLGITFRETFGNIDYSMLFTTLTTLLNKVFQALAGWVSESDLPGVAEKIGTGLTDGLKNINWTDIRQGVLGFVEDIDESINTLFGNSELMSEIGNNIANGINTIKTAIASFWEGLDAEKVGGGIGTLIDSFLETRNIEASLMHLTELPQKILRIVAEAFKNINTADLGKRIGIGLTDAIKNINLDQIGTDLSTISVKIGAFFGELFDNVSFKDLGEKASGLASKLLEAIAKMLRQVDWAKLGEDLAEGFNTMQEDFLEDEDNISNASSIVDGISTFLENIVDGINWDDLWENLGSFLEKLPLEKLWAQITKLVVKFWETKREVVKQWISDKLQGILIGAFDLLVEWFEDNYGDKNPFERIFETFKNIAFPGAEEWLSYILPSGEDIQNAITALFEGVNIDLSSIFSGGENVGELGLSIGDAFERLIPKIKELAGFIKNSLQPAIDGVKTAFDTIKTAAKKIYNYIKNVVEEIEDSDLGDVVSSGSVLLGGAAGYITNKKKNHATGMQGGVILNRGTVFGMDGDTRLVGGEAGKEAVVGVGSLSTMIQSSVLGAISPMSMSTAVEAGVRSAMQGGGSSPVVDVTLKCDSETLFRMVKQGQTAYNGRYHFVEDFA